METKNQESPHKIEEKNCSKSHCMIWGLLFIAGLLAAGSAFLWAPAILPIQENNSNLNAKVENLEAKIAHVPQGPALDQQIQEQIEKFKSTSPQIQLIYWALTVDRLVEIGLPFDHALEMLGKSAGHQFSQGLQEIAKVGMPSIPFLRRTFLNVMNHKNYLDKEAAKKSSGHSRIRLMVEDWLSRLVTIESPQAPPKNLEPILIALNQGDLPKALDILKEHPEPLLDKWETHAKARLTGMQELDAFRAQLFNPQPDPEQPIPAPTQPQNP